MPADLVQRSLRTSALVILITSPVVLYYWGGWIALAVLSGWVWSLVNLMLLTALIRTAVTPSGFKTGAALAYGLVKFPLLYSAGFGLLKVDLFPPLALLIGFTGPLAIIVLKAVARTLLGIEGDSAKPPQPSGLL